MAVSMMAWMRTFPPPSIQFHQHVIPLDLDGKAPHPCPGWRCQHFSGFDVELSPVPGAGDDLSCQFALPQWPAPMGAGVVEGVGRAGHVEHGHAASLGPHDLAGPWRFLLRLGDLHQPGHGMSSFQGDVPDHFTAASASCVCRRLWMAKTRWVTSRQRVLSSRQSSLASFRSLAISSLPALAESWAAVPASRSASASASVTATPKTFSSLRVSSFMACLPPPAPEVPRYPPKRHCTDTTRSGTATRHASWSGPLPWSVPSLRPGLWTIRRAGRAICHWPGGKRCR